MGCGAASPGAGHRFGAGDLECSVVMSADEEGVTSERADTPRVNRLLTLSDGVIAIALTLLVLQLRVPAVTDVAHPDSAADLAAELGKGSAQLVSYGISFYVIAQFWVVHRQVFRQIGEKEDGLEWWNFAFLFTISIMPFTSTLLGTFVSNPLAVDIFAANLLIASLATQAMIVIARREGALISDARARMGRIQAAVVPVVMAASIGLSWWSTAAALYSWILIAVVPPAIDRWATPGRTRLGVFR
jgi:TMEM175 potassium channel family protein